MKRPFRALLVAAATVLPTSAVPAAVPRPEPFQADHVVVADVGLASPDGKPLGQLKKGTSVAARAVSAGVVDVKTADGRFGLADAGALRRLGSDIAVTQAARDVAAANNRFAFDLYQRAAGADDGNLFFSPASISTALAMTYAGAGAKTRDEMAAVLHLERLRNVDDGFSTLLQLMNSAGERNGYAVSTANRLWGARDVKLEPSFLALSRDRYGAPMETLDFSRPEEARATINAWVAGRTRNKIVGLIGPGVLQADSRLVLANAVHFEGGWASEFYVTRQARFHRTLEDRIEVPTMQQQLKHAYAEDATVQVLALPYRASPLSLVVVLPEARDGLAAVEAALTTRQFNGWTSALGRGRRVDVYLPKFKLRSNLSLGGMLKALGMTEAFENTADFSAMSRSEQLKISAVVHQAFVEVDEKGTEAAAATAVVMAATTAAPMPPVASPPPVEFRADHPFLFCIRDDRTGAILFLGRVQNPGE